eukprot:5025483-Prymnesium_polylepis.1
MARSLQIHPLISIITILPHRTPRAPFSRVRGSITPVVVSPPATPPCHAPNLGAGRGAESAVRVTVSGAGHSPHLKGGFPLRPGT